MREAIFIPHLLCYIHTGLQNKFLQSNLPMKRIKFKRNHSSVDMYF